MLLVFLVEHTKIILPNNVKLYQLDHIELKGQKHHAKCLNFFYNNYELRLNCRQCMNFDRCRYIIIPRHSGLKHIYCLKRGLECIFFWPKLASDTLCVFLPAYQNRPCLINATFVNSRCCMSILSSCYEIKFLLDVIHSMTSLHIHILLLKLLTLLA